MLAEKAYAKINWALVVTGRRGDGYHLLDMLMQPIALCDELSAEEADSLSLVIEGDDIEAGPNNLVLRAARALQAHTGTSLGAHLYLKCRVPNQAGLGAGSADCAAALRLLKRLWHLEIPDEELLSIGARLGADVPFCLTNRYARVQGIGERVLPLSGAKQWPLVIVKPKLGVSTPEAFRLLDKSFPQNSERNLDNALIALSNGDWQSFAAYAGNDLLAPAIQLAPQIGGCIGILQEQGALYADMTGSGSAVYGVFADMATAEQAAETIGRGAFATYTLA